MILLLKAKMEATVRVVPVTKIRVIRKRKRPLLKSKNGFAKRKLQLNEKLDTKQL
jgi:hypothetical protein